MRSMNRATQNAIFAVTHCDNVFESEDKEAKPRGFAPDDCDLTDRLARHLLPDDLLHHFEVLVNSHAQLLGQCAYVPCTSLGFLSPVYRERLDPTE